MPRSVYFCSESLRWRTLGKRAVSRTTAETAERTRAIPSARSIQRMCTIILFLDLCWILALQTCVLTFFIQVWIGLLINQRQSRGSMWYFNNKQQLKLCSLAVTLCFLCGTSIYTISRKTANPSAVGSAFFLFLLLLTWSRHKVVRCSHVVDFVWVKLRSLESDVVRIEMLD